MFKGVIKLSLLELLISIFAMIVMPSLYWLDIGKDKIANVVMLVANFDVAVLIVSHNTHARYFLSLNQSSINNKIDMRHLLILPLVLYILLDLVDRELNNSVYILFISAYLFVDTHKVQSKFRFNQDFELWVYLILAVIIIIAATIGDLIQSKFKREAKVKDSGSLIPGHGGFYDRMDSVLYTAPFVNLFLILVHYVS